MYNLEKHIYKWISKNRVVKITTPREACKAYSKSKDLLNPEKIKLFIEETNMLSKKFHVALEDVLYEAIHKGANEEDIASSLRQILEGKLLNSNKVVNMAKLQERIFPSHTNHRRATSI